MLSTSISKGLHGFAFLFSYKAPPAKLRATAWLDGLRGVAALEVVIYHYAELWGAIDVGYGSQGEESKTWLRLPLIRTLYDSGAAMVCLFFIISGFVLTQRILRALQRKDMADAFSILSSSVLRRGLRLFPPAIFSAFIAFLLFRLFEIRPYGAHPVFVPHFDTFLGQLHHWIVETIRYVNPFDSNLRDGWTVVDGKIRFLGHSYANVIWTIPVEYYGSMACYLELIAMAPLPSRTRSILLAFIAIWGLLVSRWILFCFNAGILMAQWLLEPTSASAVPQNKSRSMLCLSALIAGMYLAGSPDRGAGPGSNPSFGFNIIWALVPESYTALNFNYTIWSIGGLLIATSIAQLDRARGVLETGFIQYLGKISFSMYLLHIIVRDLFGHYLQALLLQEAAEQYTETTGSALETSVRHVWVVRYLACVLWYAIMLPLVFIASGVFEQFVDAPLIKFAKWCETKLLDSQHDSEEIPMNTVQ